MFKMRTAAWPASGRSSAISAQSAAAIWAAFAGTDRDNDLDWRRDSEELDTGVSRRPLRSVEIFHVSYDAPVHREFSVADFFAEQFWIKGSAEVTVDGTRVVLGPHQASVISPGARVSLHFNSNLEQLVLRVQPEALTRKLNQLTGVHCGKALRFTPAANLQQPGAQSLLRFLTFLNTEFDLENFELPTLALTEFEEALMVSFLCANRHNYSHLLDAMTPSPAPWQIRRTEEYIEAHWDQPITVEALAIATGASTRSIFHLFKQCRGYSPMAFVKRIRLQHAKEMLASSDTETSVTHIAFACGFGNLGHFSRDYFRSFGELPSQTLNRAKGR
jgi:AraC-like DNA-binding protein